MGRSERGRRERDGVRREDREKGEEGEKRRERSQYNTRVCSMRAELRTELRE